LKIKRDELVTRFGLVHNLAGIPGKAAKLAPFEIIDHRAIQKALKGEISSNAFSLRSISLTLDAATLSWLFASSDEYYGTFASLE